MKNILIVWIIVFFAIAASYGSVMGMEEFSDFIRENEMYGQLIGISPDTTADLMTKLFAAMVNSLMGLACLIPIIATVLKPRTEESDGRAEHILTRSVSRVKYITNYIIIAFVASIILQTATAVGLYISAMAVLESPLPFSFLLQASLVYLPGIWVFIGITALLIGLFPKHSSIIWIYYAFSFFALFIGRMLDLPKWLTSLSPLEFVPQLPTDEINMLTLAVLTVVAVVLSVAGVVFYRRRDTLTV
jgi:ABC-2 type transport system permease protein